MQVYVPLAQDTPGDVFLLVTPTTGIAEALATPVRAATARIDTAQLVSVRDVMALDDVAAEANARHRFRAVLVMTFAELALLLALVGIFRHPGLLGAATHREVGVRRALGGSTRHVWSLVVGGVVR